MGRTSYSCLFISLWGPPHLQLQEVHHQHPRSQRSSPPTPLVMFCKEKRIKWDSTSQYYYYWPQWQIQPIALSIAVPEDGAQLPGLSGLTVAVLRAAGGKVRAALRPGQISRVSPEGRSRTAAQASTKAQEWADLPSPHQQQGRCLTWRCLQILLSCSHIFYNWQSSMCWNDDR